ncbi:MAG: hypothetical protein LBU47_01360, partial [Christensenellaceae bacterium]|nr:hypothetical protein [Christensenellaceae bacterium]
DRIYSTTLSATSSEKTTAIQSSATCKLSPKGILPTPNPFLYKAQARFSLFGQNFAPIHESLQPKTPRF